VLKKCKNKKSTLPLLELATIRGPVVQIRLSNKINMENVKLFSNQIMEKKYSIMVLNIYMSKEIPAAKHSKETIYI
jgi:hypothetical protein